MGWKNNCMYLMAGAASMYIYSRYRPPSCSACRARREHSKRASQGKGTDTPKKHNSSLTGSPVNAFTSVVGKIASFFGCRERDDDPQIPDGSASPIETPPMGLEEYIHTLYEKEKTPGQFPCMPHILDPADIVFRLNDAGEKISLGSGTAGEVFLGKNKKTGQTVAIKVFNNRECGIDFVVREAALLTHLNDTKATPYCHGLLHLESDSQPLDCGIVMEFVGDISNDAPALDILSFSLKHKLNKTQLRSLFIKIAQKLREIHNSGVVLNDLRKGNVLVVFNEDSTVEPVLIDLGSGRYGNMEFQVPQSYRTNRHLYTHMAPELLRMDDTNPLVCPATDVFSYGKLIDEIGNAHNVMVFMECGIFCTRGTQHKRMTMDRVLEILEKTNYSCVMENLVTPM